MGSVAAEQFVSVSLSQLKRETVTLFERDVVAHSNQSGLLDGETSVSLRKLVEEDVRSRGASGPDGGEWYVSFSWVDFKSDDLSGLTVVKSPEIPGLNLAAFRRQKGVGSYLMEDPLAIRLGSAFQLPKQLTIQLSMIFWRDGPGTPLRRLGGGKVIGLKVLKVVPRPALPDRNTTAAGVSDQSHQSHQPPTYWEAQ